MRSRGWMVVLTCGALFIPMLFWAQSRHSAGNSYVDRGQESNINNVIHAHTRRGNAQLKSLCDDPRDPCGRNAREFGNILDDSPENAVKPEDISTNKAAKFTLKDNRNPTPAESWQQYIDGAISCKDRAVITCAPEGISYASLDSDATRWSLPGPRPDWPPTLAGNTVALIADNWNMIFGFSRRTGKQIWAKEVSCNVLASDGRYFYIIRTGYWDLQALNPASGKVVWSLQLPPDPQGGYSAFLKV